MMAENRDDLDHEGVQDDADRGMPSINQRGKSSGGMMQKVVAVGGAIVVVLALIAVNGGFSSDEKPEERAPASSDAIGNRLGPALSCPRRPLPRNRPGASRNNRKSSAPARWPRRLLLATQPTTGVKRTSRRHHKNGKRRLRCWRLAMYRGRVVDKVASLACRPRNAPAKWPYNKPVARVTVVR